MKNKKDRKNIPHAAQKNGPTQPENATQVDKTQAENVTQVDKTQAETQNGDGKKSYAFFICAVVGLVAAATAFGLSFVPVIGVYSLIVSVLCELAALAFLSSQKRRLNFKGVKIATVAAYALLALSMALFAGGIVYMAANKPA